MLASDEVSEAPTLGGKDHYLALSPDEIDKQGRPFRPTIESARHDGLTFGLVVLELDLHAITMPHASMIQLTLATQISRIAGRCKDAMRTVVVVKSCPFPALGLKIHSVSVFEDL